MATEPKSHFRAHARRHLRLDATLNHPRAGWERGAEVFDVGLGGACIGISETLHVGDRVSIAFMAPTLWDPLAIPARVAWFRPGAGLEPARAGLAIEYRSASAARALFELVGSLGYEG
jgi:hypothetical protein